MCVGGGGARRKVPTPDQGAEWTKPVEERDIFSRGGKYSQRMKQRASWGEGKQAVS